MQHHANGVPQDVPDESRLTRLVRTSVTALVDAIHAGADITDNNFCNTLAGVFLGINRTYNPNVECVLTEAQVAAVLKIAFQQVADDPGNAENIVANMWTEIVQSWGDEE